MDIPIVNHNLPPVKLEFGPAGKLTRKSAAILRLSGMRYCAKCRSVKHIALFSPSGYRCKACVSDDNRGRDWSRKLGKRRDLKVELMNEIGGTFCRKCGFDEFIDALDFHHIDGKKEHIAAMLTRGDSPEVRAEAKRCVVLCSNCHRGYHAGAIKLDFLDERVSISTDEPSVAGPTPTVRKEFKHLLGGVNLSELPLFAEVD